MFPGLPFGGAFLPLIGSVAGKIGDALFGTQQSNLAYSRQKEFAQNSIQWRVKDAEAAGIHPLYALGANTMSFSPTPVGTNFGDMGQDIGRAVEAAGTPATRAATALAMERASLENDLLRAQIASERARLVGQVGPPIPDMNNPGSMAVNGQPSTGPVPVGANTASQPVYVNGRLVMPANSGTSPAQDIENRYGDFIQELYGMGVLGSDLWKWYGPNSPHWKRTVDPVVKPIDDWIWNAIVEMLGVKGAR